MANRQGNMADLPGTWESELSENNLRELAGDAVFGRGLDYFHSGKVSLKREAGGAATFKVKGTQTYTTELYFEDDLLGVDCNCRHAQEGSFCKHVVASSLFWAQFLGGNVVVAQPNQAQAATKSIASQKRQATTASKREALRAFVFTQSAEALAGKLWSWAEADRDIMAELRAWQTQAKGTDTPGAWKPAVTELLRSTRSFYDWNESGIYADRASNVLPLLEMITLHSGEQGRMACVYALRKIYKVAEHADDSNGEIGGLMRDVQDQLLGALKSSQPPAKWLDEWFALMAEDPWGMWDEQAVVEVAGPAVQQRYSERVLKDWADYQAKYQAEISKSKKAPQGGTVHAVSFAGSDYSHDRWKLRKRCLDELKRQGDNAAVLDFLQRGAHEAHEHSELVQFCESIGKAREALQFALVAYKRYPTDWRMEADVLRCYERDGWDAEALAIHRQRLERQPTAEHFAGALKAATTAGHNSAQYRSELYEWAASLEVQIVQKPQAAWQRPLPVEEGRNVSLRVQWLLFEKLTDEALALVQVPHTCASDLLHTLSVKIYKDQPNQALVLLHRVFVFEMPRASTPYKQVLDLVKLIAPLMKTEARQTWLTGLRAEYRAKRNFIKGLDSLKVSA